MLISCLALVEVRILSAYWLIASKALCQQVCKSVSKGKTTSCKTPRSAKLDRPHTETCRVILKISLSCFL